MDLRASVPCPQCGGPVELGEAERLFRCPYCGVKNLFTSRSPSRIILPPRRETPDLTFVPYYRFKGAVYLIHARGVLPRFVDMTHRAVELSGPFPLSLGLRPQALRLQYATGEPGTRLLPCSLPPRRAMDGVRGLVRVSGRNHILQWTFIGETLSLVYLPVYLEGGMLVDAVSGNSLGPMDTDAVAEFSPRDSTPWKPAFLPALCPRCGGDLEGEKESVVLFCGNCLTAWEPVERRFVEVQWEALPSEDITRARLLPFWRVELDVESLGFVLPDGIRKASLLAKAASSSRNPGFLDIWVPAFKIRPKLFLMLSKRMTLAQPQDAVPLPQETGALHPVNLPASEVTEALAPVLAFLGLRDVDALSHLSEATAPIIARTLVSIPFSSSGPEFVHRNLSLSIQKNALRFGQNL